MTTLQGCGTSSLDRLFIGELGALLYTLNSLFLASYQDGNCSVSGGGGGAVPHVQVISKITIKSQVSWAPH